MYRYHWYHEPPAIKNNTSLSTLLYNNLTEKTSCLNNYLRYCLFNSFVIERYFSLLFGQKNSIFRRMHNFIVHRKSIRGSRAPIPALNIWPGASLGKGTSLCLNPAVHHPRKVNGSLMMLIGPIPISSILPSGTLRASRGTSPC